MRISLVRFAYDTWEFLDGEFSFSSNTGAVVGWLEEMHEQRNQQHMRTVDREARRRRRRR